MEASDIAAQVSSCFAAILRTFKPMDSAFCSTVKFLFGLLLMWTVFVALTHLTVVLVCKLN